MRHHKRSGSGSGSEGPDLSARIRVGIDVGGTFTDFVLVDERRDVIYTCKLLTTPSDPVRAIVNGLERLLADARTPIADLHSIVHGTTLVANTIIERTGARVGLITTQGHRDALEMVREIRYDLYDLQLERPQPLVPRVLRREVCERIDARGAVLVPLDPDEVRAVGRAFAAEGVEAIAVCFLHSYRNPVHEEVVRRALAEACPEIPVSLSSEIAPEIREYERANTTCANAYVQPRMARYLAHLEATLGARGVRGPSHVMLSNGGITTVRAAREVPIRLIESGPAGGAMAAAYYGILTKSSRLVAFDMGGTTAKVALIEHGAPDLAHEFEAGRVRRFCKGSGLPLKVPVVDLMEIGAGGGSVAWVDALGLLKIGPESAGADPGPVCYGFGGKRPTVTDADLLLGYLSPDYFLGGEMVLDRAAVERTIEAQLAGPLGLSTVDAAIGIHDLVNENMATAGRMHIAEKGRDPRNYTLIAFGGAGPVHAYGVAKRLNLARIVCPLGAGVASALGFLVSAPAVDDVRSYVARLKQADWDHVTGLFAKMEAEARALLVETGAESGQVAVRRAADMRYAGQGFEITVPLPEGALDRGRLLEVTAAFLRTYEARFARRITDDDAAIEAVSWRLKATAPVPNIRLNFAGQPRDSGDPIKGTRPVYFHETGFAPCTVYDRYALGSGATFRGPAIVEERESTAVVGPDARARVDDYLNLIIEIE